MRGGDQGIYLASRVQFYWTALDTEEDELDGMLSRREVDSADSSLVSPVEAKHELEGSPCSGEE